MPWKKIVVAWKKIAVITGAVAGIFALAATVGFAIDRPVWLSEFMVLESKVGDNTLYRHKDAAASIQRQTWQVEDRIQKVGTTPDLVFRLRELRASLREAKARLVKIRGY